MRGVPPHWMRRFERTFTRHDVIRVRVMTAVWSVLGVAAIAGGYDDAVGFAIVGQGVMWGMTSPDQRAAVLGRC